MVSRRIDYSAFFLFFHLRHANKIDLLMLSAEDISFCRPAHAAINAVTAPRFLYFSCRLGKLFPNPGFKGIRILLKKSLKGNCCLGSDLPYFSFNTFAFWNSSISALVNVSYVLIRPCLLHHTEHEK